MQCWLDAVLIIAYMWQIAMAACCLDVAPRLCRGCWHLWHLACGEDREGLSPADTKEHVRTLLQATEDHTRESGAASSACIEIPSASAWPPPEPNSVLAADRHANDEGAASTRGSEGKDAHGLHGEGPIICVEGAVYCADCQMWLNGPTQWYNHRIGKKHRKNVLGQVCARTHGTP